MKKNILTKHTHPKHDLIKACGTYGFTNVKLIHYKIGGGDWYMESDQYNGSLGKTIKDAAATLYSLQHLAHFKN